MKNAFARTRTNIYLPDQTLLSLCSIVRFEPVPNAQRKQDRMWLSLPHGTRHDLPLYTTIEASPVLSQFIRTNSIYGADADLDKNHYLSVTFRDDETALISMQYQQIIGSRWLCVVPQLSVVQFIRNGARK